MLQSRTRSVFVFHLRIAMSRQLKWCTTHKEAYIPPTQISSWNIPEPESSRAPAASACALSLALAASSVVFLGNLSCLLMYSEDVALLTGMACFDLAIFAAVCTRASLATQGGGR